MLGVKGRIYYGWIIVAAAAGLEFANAASAIGILTVFVNPMTQELGWSRTQIAGATSVGALLGAAIAPFTGRLVDRIGSRFLLALGGTVVALSCLYLAVAQTLLGFYVAFTLARVADQGLIKASASPAVGKWFLRYRGRAIALVFFASSAGIIVLAPVVQLVIDTWNWRVAWMMLGALMFFLGVIPSVLLIRRQPEDMRLVVDGAAHIQATPTEPAEAQLTASIHSPIQQPASASADGPARQTDDAEVSWLLKEATRTPTFWLVLVSLLWVSTASSGVGLHLVPHLTQQGLSSAAAVGAISIQSTSGAVGALLWGFLAERFPPRLLLSLAYGLAAISLSILMLADTLVETYAYAVLQGLASGGISALPPILWASYYGRQSLGSIYGLSRAFQVTGFALGPLLSGLVYDATGSYQRAFIYLAFLALGTSLLVLAARRPVRPGE